MGNAQTDGTNYSVPGLAVVRRYEKSRRQQGVFYLERDVSNCMHAESLEVLK